MLTFADSDLEKLSVFARCLRRLLLADRLESDDKFMRYLTEVVRNGLGDRSGTCIDPKTQVFESKTAGSGHPPWRA